MSAAKKRITPIHACAAYVYNRERRAERSFYRCAANMTTMMMIMMMNNGVCVCVCVGSFMDVLDSASVVVGISLGRQSRNGPQTRTYASHTTPHYCHIIRLLSIMLTAAHHSVVT